MNANEIITLILVHFSFVVSIILAIVIYRKNQGSFVQIAFFFLAFILLIWNLGTTLELDYRLITGATVNSTISIILIDLCYLSICFEPVVILFLGRAIYQPDWRPKFRHLMLFIVPIVSFMMVCTNPLHDLFFSNFSLYSSEAVYGPYFYFHSVYSYGCILIGLIFIVMFALRNSGILSKQFFLILASIIIPLAGNILFSFGLVDLSFSINACLFTVSGICIFVAIVKYQLFTVTSINMRQVIDLVSDGFIQTDEKMNIVDFNNTLTNLFPNVSPVMRNSTIEEFFEQSGFGDQKNDCLNLYNQTVANKASMSMEITRPDAQSFKMQITPFFSGEEYTGNIIIFKNIVGVKSVVDADLQSTLDEIRKSNQDLNEKLEEERLARQSLYDADPHINFITDLNYDVIDGNPTAMKFYGFENKEELKNGLMKKIGQAILPIMPGGLPSIPANQRFADAVAHGESTFDTILKFNGEEIPFHFDLKIVPYKGTSVIAVYQTDLRELRNVEKDLEKRDMLLSAINTVAARLISVEDNDFEQSFGESIALLGRSINVQRVVVWKNYEKDDELYCTQIHEWSENAEIQHGKAHSINIKYKDTVPTWEKTLSHGECVNAVVKDLLPIEKEQMTKQGIVSVLAVPLFVRDIFWGFVGFDDCETERVFSKMEESTLGSGAMLIAAALFRNEITNNLIVDREDALSSSRAKGSFLANMSHEIRTPLNAIVGMAQIAKRKTTNEEALRPIDEILSASKHLMDLINDILDFSKIESGKMELVDEAIDLRAAMHEVESLITPRCAEKNITLETNIQELPEVSVLGDKLRIKQVLINLLGNAVKFTDKDGTIKFLVNEVSQTAEDIKLNFNVCDDGVGISNEQVPNLFTAFEQGDSAVAIKYGGTGLGLAISQNIVKMMGGTIVVESILGEGATFSFTVALPKTESQEASGDKEETVGELNLKGHRILLAEDIEINRVILIELLADTQVEIHEAVDGVQALQMFEQSEPGTYDLVFMDIQMPNMDGYQTAKAIRKLEREDAKEIPIIAMTANAYREDIERALASGMNNHLSKPIDIKVIKQLLHSELVSEKKHH